MREPRPLPKSRSSGDAFKRTRCLIPASGYYEWHYANPDDKKEKPQPYYFTRRDG